MKDYYLDRRATHGILVVPGVPSDVRLMSITAGNCNCLPKEGGVTTRTNVLTGEGHLTVDDAYIHTMLSSGDNPTSTDFSCTCGPHYSSKFQPYDRTVRLTSVRKRVKSSMK